MTEVPLNFPSFNPAGMRKQLYVTVEIPLVCLKHVYVLVRSK